ncbi:MAG: lysozyme [Symploca sp. SIO2C1]|nr:lysozyme [Symploca sp. SIO2C1]
MNDHLRINQAGVELIKRDRDLHQKNRKKDSEQVISTYLSLNNVLLIGYRTTNPQFRNGKNITESEAEQFFWEEIEYFEMVVKKLVEVELNENEFSALVSFAYKCGENGFKKSTVLKRLNEGDIDGCAEALQRWNKSRSGVVTRLVKRHLDEENLFLSEVMFEEDNYELDAPEIDQDLDEVPSTMTINYQKMVIICGDDDETRVLTLSPIL